jgi:hypothetical protein
MTAILAGCPRLGGCRAVESRHGPRRQPTWSAPLTRPLARLVRDAWRPRVLIAIKSIHTAIFAGVGVCIALVVADGIRQQPGRRSAYALGIALGESAIYVSNNRVCPLSPLAEDLGAERGAVADIFLPARAARSIPIVAAGTLLIGLVLNARALAKARAARRTT